MWIQQGLRVYNQNVTVYAGTTRKCVSTCARGAGTRGYVSTVHTEALLNPHRGGVVASSAHQKKTHVEFSLDTREVHQKNRWIIHDSSLRTNREQHVAHSSNHSLYMIKLFSFHYLEGNFGRIQQPDRSINLSRSPPLLPPPRPPQQHTTQHTTHRDRDRKRET